MVMKRVFQYKVFQNKLSQGKFSQNKLSQRKIFQKSIFLFFIAMTSLSLQACMNVATSGAEAVYNRHSIEKNIKDQYLTFQAHRALYRKTNIFNDANIVVSTYHREMLLVGQVPQAWQKKKAEQIIKQIPDIERIYNLISIQNPTSSLTQMNDAWITAKIKAQLLASSDVDSTQIKVVTENGTVYLMGTILPDEADAAVEIARTTDGVSRVVKIFSYVQITRKPMRARA
jgi:osmotically-inducible protein OsmY